MPELWIVYESQRERITLLQPQGAVRVVDPSFVSACNPGLIVELRSLRGRTTAPREHVSKTDGYAAAAIRQLDVTETTGLDRLL
ncbi:hypothetical protein GGQ85_003777 [Nitrobacter vulgaris]|nr:hypothetical protein [Nitrobacter vulgaris]